MLSRQGKGRILRQKGLDMCGKQETCGMTVAVNTESCGLWSVVRPDLGRQITKCLPGHDKQGMLTHRAVGSQWFPAGVYHLTS